MHHQQNHGLSRLISVHLYIHFASTLCALRLDVPKGKKLILAAAGSGTYVWLHRVCRLIEEGGGNFAT